MPMPVLPAVPSTMVAPGLSAPEASAARMIPSAARSLTDRLFEFGFAENGAAGFFGGAAQVDQGRVADGINKAVAGGTWGERTFNTLVDLRAEGADHGTP